MASESVRRILSAEAEANKKNAEARRKAEEIISDAEKQSAVAVQKKLAEARAETEKVRLLNNGRLSEYADNAKADCEKKLAEIRKQAEKNSEKAIDAIINGIKGV